MRGQEKIYPSIVLIKSELYKQGGLEKYTWQIAQNFCLSGISVTILTTGIVHPPLNHPLLKIITFSIDHSFSVLNLLYFNKACSEFLKKHPTPIVFGLDRTSFQTHLRAGNGVHAAYLRQRSKEEGIFKRLTFAFNPLHQTILSLEKKGFEHPDLEVLFTNSEMVKQEILEFYDTHPDKIQVVHNGVEWHTLQVAFDQWESQKEKTLQELKLDSKALQLLFIGHNFRRKGLQKLLEALALIKEEHFQLSIVGKDKNTSYFESLVQRLGLSQKVFFFGAQKEIIPFYQMADVLIIPSLYDPFANVTVEALAMGLFVVSSSFNGGHEVLCPQNGIVIESLDDSYLFAQALLATFNSRKTTQSAYRIRQTVKHLDFSNQLKRIATLTIPIPFQ